LAVIFIKYKGSIFSFLPHIFLQSIQLPYIVTLIDIVSNSYIARLFLYYAHCISVVLVTKTITKTLLVWLFGL